MVRIEEFVKVNDNIPFDNLWTITVKLDKFLLDVVDIFGTA